MNLGCVSTLFNEVKAFLKDWKLVWHLFVTLKIFGKLERNSVLIEGQLQWR